MDRQRFWLGLASLVIAFLLWYQTQDLFEPGREREFAVPLRYEGISDDLVAMTPAEPVMVVASGSTADLEKLDTQKIEAVVDLAGASPGENRQLVRIVGPDVPGLMIRPRKTTYAVTVERVERIQLPVVLATSGVPPAGLVLVDASVVPKNVEVFGPTSYVSRVKTARVTLDLSELTLGATGMYGVEILDQGGKPVPSMRSNPGEVTVSPRIEAAAQIRQVPVVVNWSGSLPRGFVLKSYTVVPNQVELSGASEVVGKIGSVETVAVDLSSLRSDGTVKKSLVFPAGVKGNVQEVEVKMVLGERE